MFHSTVTRFFLLYFGKFEQKSGFSGAEVKRYSFCQSLSVLGACSANFIYLFPLFQFINFDQQMCHFPYCVRLFDVPPE